MTKLDPAIKVRHEPMRIAGKKVEFSGRLQVNPTDEQLPMLAELLSKSVSVRIELAQKELALAGGTAVAGAAQEPEDEQQESLDLAQQHAEQNGEPAANDAPAPVPEAPTQQETAPVRTRARGFTSGLE